MSSTVDGRRRSRSRRTLSLLVVLTLTGCALALLAFRREAMEGWLLWRLESRDPAVRDHAAARLAERGALRAVPRLIDHIAGDERETITWNMAEKPFRSIRDYLEKNPDATMTLELTPLLHALYRLGPDAESAIEEWLLKLRKADDPLKVDRGFDLEHHCDLLRDAWKSPGRYTVEKTGDRPSVRT